MGKHNRHEFNESRAWTDGHNVVTYQARQGRGPFPDSGWSHIDTVHATACLIMEATGQKNVQLTPEATQRGLYAVRDTIRELRRRVQEQQGELEALRSRSVREELISLGSKLLRGIRERLR